MVQQHFTIENSTFGATGDVCSHNVNIKYQVVGAYPELRHFLSPLDTENWHHNIRSKLTGGTGGWLLNSDGFKRWKDGRGPQILCLAGEPGTGKSSIFCHVVEFLRSYPREPRTAVSFIYCDYVNGGQQTARNLIGALLCQIVTHLNHKTDILAKLQERMQHNHSLSMDENTYFLCKAAAEFTTVWLCADALDELDSAERIKLLQEFTRICQFPVFRIFFTGRSNSALEDSIHQHLIKASPSTTIDYTLISKDGSIADIRRFLEERLRQDTAPSVMNDTLRKAIFDRLAGEDSTFLVAAFSIELVLQKRTIRGRKEMLNSQVPDLETYYRDTVRRIEERDKEFGMKILQWVLFAARPLTVKELRYAIAIRPKASDLNPEEDLPPMPFTESTLGLVAIDNQWTETVRFVHFTVKEHLLRNSTLYFPNGHALLAEAAMTYLTFDTLRTEVGLARYLNGGNLQTFFDYASNNWGQHVRECQEEDVISRAYCLLRNDAFPSLQTLYKCSNRGTWIWVDFYASPLHAASYFGLHIVLKLLLAKDPWVATELGLQDQESKTPLFYAVENGYIETVELLLAQKDIDLNIRDVYGCTPLSYAASRGHTNIVKAFLEQENIHVNPVDITGWTPLFYAVSRGHVEIVKLILEWGEKIDQAHGDSDGVLVPQGAKEEDCLHTSNKANNDLNVAYTILRSIMPILWRNGEINDHELPVQRGINVNSAVGGDTLLSLAVWNNDIEVVKLLLGRNEIDVNLAGQEGHILSHAVSCGYMDIAKLLLGRDDINVNLPNIHGYTPLCSAIRQGAFDIVEMLLQRDDISVNLVDGHGHTPLVGAIFCGYLDVVEKLLKRRELNVNSVGWRSHTAHTPLLCAVVKGQINVIKLLLERNDINVNLADPDGYTPLCYAVVGNRIDVVELLLQREDVDANLATKWHGTPLLFAIVEGHVDLAKLLLKREDIDINKADYDGNTPVSSAIQQGHIEIAMLLVERGAVIYPSQDVYLYVEGWLTVSSAS